MEINVSCHDRDSPGGRTQQRRGKGLAPPTGRVPKTITTAGAEGVGRATARAVVITSVVILVIDALTAVILAPLLQ